MRPSTQLQNYHCTRLPIRRLIIQQLTSFLSVFIFPSGCCHHTRVRKSQQLKTPAPRLSGTTPNAKPPALGPIAVKVGWQGAPAPSAPLSKVICKGAGHFLIRIILGAPSFIAIGPPSEIAIFGLFRSSLIRLGFERFPAKKHRNTK